MATAAKSAAETVKMTPKFVNIKQPMIKSLLVFLLAALAPMIVAPRGSSVGAQGVKGGSGFVQQLSSPNFQQPQAQPQVANTGQQQLSFVQMFNQLTPTQQQQFIKQMSSSNKRIFQQLIQPQPQQQVSGFSEEISSTSSASQAPQPVIGATKSIRSSQQVAALFRPQQATKTVSRQQPAGDSQLSLTRQISSQNVQQPTSIIITQQPQQQQQQQQLNEQIFQKTLSNIIQQQQPQQVVQPASEQSFRRVQSFSSQPLVVQQPANVDSTSGFSQQFVQQPQPQPTGQQSLNRFQQFTLSAQPVIAQQPSVGGFTSQQFSTSSSSNLAGGQQSLMDGSGFSGTLQEKVTESNLGGPINADGLQLISPQQQQVFTNQFGQQASFDSTPTSTVTGIGGSIGVAGFESADAQQKNFQIPDDFYGLTAASINNRWYIMRPVENPSALGLGDATTAGLRQIPISRTLLSGPNTAAAQRQLQQQQANNKLVSGATNVTTTTATAIPKKRSVPEKQAESGVETIMPASSSSGGGGSENSSEGGDESDERK